MPSPSLGGFEHKVVVGIADLVVSNNPNVVLTTYSLGSCIGVAIYDPAVQVGGLLHAMLPDSTIDQAKASSNPAMFVDTGFPVLLRLARELHAERSRLRILVAGGAQIMDSSGFFNIGRRNYDTLLALMDRERLKATAESVGGFVNRTLNLRLCAGEVLVKISGQPQELRYSLCGK